MASFNRAKPCVSTSESAFLSLRVRFVKEPLLWLSKIASSSDPLVCSKSALAKSSHLLDNLSYSDLNSFSSLSNLFNSQLSSNAVKMGSLLDKAMSEGEAKA